MGEHCSTASNSSKGVAETKQSSLTSTTAQDCSSDCSKDVSEHRYKNSSHTELGLAQHKQPPFKRSCSEPYGFKPFRSQLEDISYSHPEAAGITPRVRHSCRTKKGSLQSPLQESRALQSPLQESREGGRPCQLVNGAITIRLTRSLPREGRERDGSNHPHF